MPATLGARSTAGTATSVTVASAGIRRYRVSKPKLASQCPPTLLKTSRFEKSVSLFSLFAMGAFQCASVGMKENSVASTFKWTSVGGNASNQESEVRIREKGLLCALGVSAVKLEW